jgi:hypothetical protein
MSVRQQYRSFPALALHMARGSPCPASHARTLLPGSSCVAASRFGRGCTTVERQQPPRWLGFGSNGLAGALQGGGLLRGDHMAVLRMSDLDSRQGSSCTKGGAGSESQLLGASTGVVPGLPRAQGYEQEYGFVLVACNMRRCRRLPAW